ncbi:MAG: AAA family ATPase, partial [Chitinophagaceae bacterium]|nr:AAA family ATPase [Chitinophagaceae bacterium]
MYLKRLTLFNFKNYSETEFNFSSGANALTGPNGSGKTNVLDAIHYLCLCKSYFNASDSHAVRHDASYFSVGGHFEL